MRISRFQIISAVVLVVVGASQQGCVPKIRNRPARKNGGKPSTSVRAINTAEVRYSSHISQGRFASWSELYDSGLVKELQVSPSPEVIPRVSPRSARVTGWKVLYGCVA